jgi:hypothetical protein
MGQKFEFISYKKFPSKGNTETVFIGDLMMIRVLFDLEKGAEVILPVNPFFPLQIYEERNNYFIRRWGFQCDCRLCILDRQEPKELAKKRKKLVEDFSKEKL